ncbi:hypothetical protein Pint_12339 [Pistacia integerrima]|uniref:Uncharacterized protein n=1 Tax=Pistacia integerrima TaxID=434235 RepID=A0ACC0XI65_9ROSI|nr:hypothetical protein Pint_12339 [Pistacia integerrima]
MMELMKSFLVTVQVWWSHTLVL